MTGDNGKIHMGDAVSLVRKMNQNQRDNAQLHLIHDFGMDAAKFIGTHYSSHEIQKGILRQRAEMTLADTLYDAEGKLVGEIDLAKLGITPEHITQIEALKAAEDKKVVGAHTAAAAAEKAGRALGGAPNVG
jgi:hypothetical protein